MTAAIAATIAITGAKGTNTALRPLDNAENIVGINLIALNAILRIVKNVLGKVKAAIAPSPNINDPLGPKNSYICFPTFSIGTIAAFI